MPSFAIIAEGVTDQAVIENIVYGVFAGDEDEPVVTHFQPPRDATSNGGAPAPGGWTLVFRALREGQHRKALQLNDYVILQIDTDRSEDVGFDVSHRDGDGRPLPPDELIARVEERLKAAMGAEFCARHGSRIVFAIAVDEVECWLLPLLYPDSEGAKKGKLTGCLEAANWKLRRLEREPLSKANGDDKNLASYERTSKEYRKPRKLAQHRAENPSLDVFVRNLDALRVPTAGRPEQPPAPAP